MDKIQMEKILVYDFGGQYAHLIANRIRRLGVYSEISAPDSYELKDVRGIILSGGPQSVYAPGALKISKEILDANVPILGICYGHQLLSHLLRGRVEPGQLREYGHANFFRTHTSGLLMNTPEQFRVWMSHADLVTQPPSDFTILGSTETCPVAAMGEEERKIFGVQFHPEVTHTAFGIHILNNFLNLCDIKRQWNPTKRLAQLLQTLQQSAQNKRILLFVSGGVDSLVTFALLQKALGNDCVYGVHVDTGFMRHTESLQIKKELKEAGFSIHVIDASQFFLSSLQGVTDPEEKRRLIGEAFLSIRASEMHRLHLKAEEWLFAQGTIYPDTIESGGTHHADTIKTHHNRVLGIQQLAVEGRLLEPLKDFYKDEVRALGRELGLPESLLSKHPFPGPGLAIRCLCLTSPSEPPAELREKVNEYVQSYHYSAEILPLRSVGVQGDNRSYAHPVVLYGPMDWKVLGELATRVINIFPEVNRVLYSLTPKEPLVPVEAYLSPDRVEKLRQLDAVATNFLDAYNLYHQIWQMPVVLLPLFCQQKESLVLRPVTSTEAMTASVYHFDPELLSLLVAQLHYTRLVHAIFYDLTTKPPGTIEWE